ncbi:MAG: DUF4326 domain-containing protein [Hyphomonadaceae bacterium]
MSAPRRLQLRKGRRLAPGARSVAAGTQWGNPYRVGVDGDAAECVRKYHEYLMPYRHGMAMDVLLLSEANMLAAQNDLAGLDLACWCRLCPEHKDGKPLGVDCASCAPCHADVLIFVANIDI